MFLSLEVQHHLGNIPAKRWKLKSHQDSVSNYHCTGNREFTYLSPRPFGMFALGSLCLGIQLPRFEKFKPHGAATCRYFCWQLQLSSQLIVVISCQHMNAPSSLSIWFMTTTAWDIPNENCPADPNQPTEPRELIINVWGTKFWDYLLWIECVSFLPRFISWRPNL